MEDFDISAENLKIQFGSEVVLEKVNLKVRKGERLVIVGPSGHGKSVLLKSLAGLLQPNSGEVSVKEKNLYRTDKVTKQELMKRMGMLFQKNALFDSMTVLENVTFPLEQVTDFSEVEIKKRAEGYIEAVGLGHAFDLFPDELSGGMQKRLGIARAMALKPEILFYDDPTAGLDPITSRKIVELIIDLNIENRGTVVMITNDMNRAFQIADRMVMIVDRELIITGDELETKDHADPRVRQFVMGLLEGPLRVVE